MEGVGIVQGVRVNIVKNSQTYYTNYLQKFQILNKHPTDIHNENEVLIVGKFEGQFFLLYKQEWGK